jgi:hypothetical protein
MFERGLLKVFEEIDERMEALMDFVSKKMASFLKTILVYNFDYF